MGSNFFLTGGNGTGFLLWSPITGMAPTFPNTGSRDVYFSNNPSELARLDSNEFLIVKVGSMTITYYNRQSNAWVEVTSLVQGEQGIPGMAANIANLNDGDIPIKGVSDVEFETSPLKLNSAGNRVVSDMAIEVPPGTIYIGESTALGAAIRSLHVRSGVTGNRALLLAQLYTPTGGFQNAFVYSGGAQEDVLINDPAGTDNSDTAIFSITTTADELITSISIPTNQISQSVTFTLIIRTVSQSGPVAVNFSGNLTTDASGIATLDLSADHNPLLIDSGVELFVNATCDGMIGIQTGPTFVPNATIRRIVVTRVNIATVNDIITGAERTKLTEITSTGSGSIISAAERTKLTNLNENAEDNVQSDWTEPDPSSDSFINNKPDLTQDIVDAVVKSGTSDTITFTRRDTTSFDITLSGAVFLAPVLEQFSVSSFPSRIDTTANLEGDHSATLVIDNHQNVDGNLTVMANITAIHTIDNSSLVEGSNSFSINISSAEWSAIIAGNPTSIVFKVTGIDTQTATIESNAVTTERRDLAQHEFLYYGLSASNNPAGVDISGFSSTEITTAGQQITVGTGTTTTGQYFIILVPSSFDITTIIDDVLQQNVTDIFAKTTNVRQINSENYNSFVLGPLNAGGNENYVATLGGV